MAICYKAINNAIVGNKSRFIGFLLFLLMGLFPLNRAMAADVTITTNWPTQPDGNSVQIFNTSNTTAISPVISSSSATYPTASYTLLDNKTYTLRMSDSVGDGWNGGNVTVAVDGVVVKTLTGPTGFSSTATFKTGTDLSVFDYIGPTEYSIALNTPVDFFLGSLDNLTDALDLSTTELHTNDVHYFVEGADATVDLRFTLSKAETLNGFHIWNSDTPAYYAASANLKFYNGSGSLLHSVLVDELPIGNAQGTAFSEYIPPISDVAYVDVFLTAGAGGVDLLNVGFSRPTANDTNTAPPSPSLDIVSCEAITPLSASPDGLEDLAFPRGYWATSYYEGTDRVQGSAFSGTDGQGNAGKKTFMGEAFWGSGEMTVNFSSEGSRTDKSWSDLETPTSNNLPHPSYNGDTWLSAGNPFYQMDLRQKMTFRGELRLGYGDLELLDDSIEVFVNGLRRYAYFPGVGAPDARLDAEGITIKLEADDDVIIRLINWGNVGGFNLEITSPRPDCSDSPEDGTLNPSGNTNNYGAAAHAVFSDIRLGAAVDGEDKAIASANADGDGADDDGVTFAPFIPGSTSTVTADVSGEGGYLQAWVDWNGDGDFDDPGEQIATDVQDSDVNDTAAADGVIAFDVNVPEDAIDNPFVRIRWSTTPGLPSGGPAPDGESEDYQISTTNRPQSCDMNDLMHDIYNTAAVSANSSELSSQTLIYQATFRNENWQGNVTAFGLKTSDDDGNIKSGVWNAADSISRTGRKIFTYVPTDMESQGRRFNWSNLDDKQRLAIRSGDTIRMAKDRVEWVKGSAGSEGANGPMRVRQSILGDIVHSNLNFRGRYTNFGYKQLKRAEGNKYAAYLASKRNTKDTLFVGANDGMLHAFDAENGKELFAYIPNEIIPKLATISKPKYGCDQADCLPHEYLVDGKSSVADAYINNRWRTILVGTLGLGGKAIYALDVTKPERFVKRNILWEISDTQAPDNASVYENHMGLSVPEPVIVRMKNGQWAAVVANGYESKDNQAVLFIIDIATGQLIKAINTGFGSDTQPNGLSSPTAVDSDGDAIADVIYAGDLQGNLWAFDVSGKNPDKWGSKHGGLNAFAPSTNQTSLRADARLPEPMFRACMDSTCSQPKAITAKPQVGRNPSGGLMVYFGTGKYLDLGDNFELEQDGIIDTFYGIHDNNKVINSGNLVEQKILQETDIKADMRSRVTSKEVVIYPVKQGWFMDLVSPPNLNPEGERVISQALLREGRLIFVTLSPSQTDCAWAGSSWLMELNALDGSRLSLIPIDINGDKQFTEEDNVDYKGQSTIISGVQQQSLGMVFEPPAIISHNTRIEGKYQSGTGSSARMLRESNSRFTGRMSWKKLR